MKVLLAQYNPLYVSLLCVQCDLLNVPIHKFIRVCTFYIKPFFSFAINDDKKKIAIFIITIQKHFSAIKNTFVNKNGCMNLLNNLYGFLNLKMRDIYQNEREC